MTTHHSDIDALTRFLDMPHPGSKPVKGDRPVAAQWFALGSFALHSGRLRIGDSWCPGEGVVVRLPPGAYDVRVECFVYGDEAKVAGVQVLPKGAAATRGRKAGSFDVDVGSAGITDAGDIARLGDAQYENWCEAFSHQENIPSAGEHAVEGLAPRMLHFGTGWGDGDYPVYRMVSGGRTVGFEARFLAPDEPWPFESKEFYEARWAERAAAQKKAESGTD